MHIMHPVRTLNAISDEPYIPQHPQELSPPRAQEWKHHTWMLSSCASVPWVPPPIPPPLALRLTTLSFCPLVEFCEEYSPL